MILAIFMFDTFGIVIDEQAPRRQCCEVINGDDKVGGVQVKIRGCHQFESVTP